MSKVIKKTEEVFEENLKYIGLDLNKIPAFLKKHESLNFRPSKSYDDSIYKVYKYVNIKEIEILLTPQNRLNDIKEKYKLAKPIYGYMNSENEENIEDFTKFIKMVTDMDKTKIEQIEKEQAILNEKIPYEVKYTDNFIWQIYYSDYAKKYFMLVPIEEKDNSALFYLLKEQIATVRAKKPRYIFVPISHKEYSGDFLTKSEIADIENYLWYFTKEWPNIYEIFDKDNNMFIKIVGTTNIYEKIKTNYSIYLDTKEKSLELYKLLKAMFILSTGAKEEYKFITKLNEYGEIEFWNNNIKLEYSKLPDYIKMEYIDKIEKLKHEEKEQKELKRKLNKFKIVIEDLTQEYLLRQKQIATFLECKKTFFGKVKYFFKKKKEVKLNKKPEKQNIREDKKDDTLASLYELKEQYTIEDLINICTKFEEIKKENSNLLLDLNAIETKKEILSKKNDNAELYIKEIDKHKKSIFEFWKFTSKDEMQTLAEAEIEEENEKNKIGKYFDYELDLEELGKKMDELQRRKLSKNETDAIFAIKQVLMSFKEIEESSEDEAKKGKNIEKEFKQLIEEYKNNIEIINSKDFDIFGGLIEDKTKIKIINNTKHREIEKDKYKILNLNLDTNIESYIENLKSYLNLIKEALNKIKTPCDMPVYIVNSKKSIEGINIFNINPEIALEKEMKSKKANIFYKLNVKENTPAIFYTNIMFYDNFNKTLPIGMNLSTEVLIDINKLDLKCIKEDSFYMNYKLNEYEYGTKKIFVYEYEADLKK